MGFLIALIFSFLKTKQHLWKKFCDIINRLTEEEQRRYYAGQYSALLYTACKSGEKESIQWTLSQLRKYRPINKKEKLLLVLSRLYLFSVYENLKKTIKRRKSDRVYKETIKNLTSYDLQIFEDILRH